MRHAIVAGCLRHEPAIDFLSAAEAGLEGVPDEVMIEIAISENRVLVSSDLRTMPSHYPKAIADGARAPGLMLVSQEVPTAVAIESLIMFWAVTETGECENSVTYLPL